MDFMFRMVITWFCIVGQTKEAMAVVVSSPLKTGIYPSPQILRQSMPMRVLRNADVVRSGFSSLSLRVLKMSSARKHVMKWAIMRSLRRRYTGRLSNSVLRHRNMSSISQRCALARIISTAVSSSRLEHIAQNPSKRASFCIASISSVYLVLSATSALSVQCVSTMNRDASWAIFSCGGLCRF